MVCYFLSWEEPVKLKNVVGVNAGSVGTKNKGGKVFFRTPAFDTVLQRVSLWPSVATGNVGFSSAAQQQPLSRESSLCCPPKCQLVGKRICAQV